MKLCDFVTCTNMEAHNILGVVIIMWYVDTIFTLSQLPSNICLKFIRFHPIFFHSKFILRLILIRLHLSVIHPISVRGLFLFKLLLYIIELMDVTRATRHLIDSIGRVQVLQPIYDLGEVFYMASPRFSSLEVSLNSGMLQFPR